MIYLDDIVAEANQAHRDLHGVEPCDEGCRMAKDLMGEGGWGCFDSFEFCQFFLGHHSPFLGRCGRNPFAVYFDTGCGLDVEDQDRGVLEALIAQYEGLS